MDLLFFAGTGGSIPTPRRLAAGGRAPVRRVGDRILFDCGEAPSASS